MQSALSASSNWKPVRHLRILMNPLNSDCLVSGLRIWRIHMQIKSLFNLQDKHTAYVLGPLSSCTTMHSVKAFHWKPAAAVLPGVIWIVLTYKVCSNRMRRDQQILMSFFQTKAQTGCCVDAQAVMIWLAREVLHFVMPQRRSIYESYIDAKIQESWIRMLISISSGLSHKVYAMKWQEAVKSGLRCLNNRAIMSLMWPPGANRFSFAGW